MAGRLEDMEETCEALARQAKRLLAAGQLHADAPTLAEPALPSADDPLLREIAAWGSTGGSTGGNAGGSTGGNAGGSTGGNAGGILEPQSTIGTVAHAADLGALAKWSVGVEARAHETTRRRARGGGRVGSVGTNQLLIFTPTMARQAEVERLETAATHDLDITRERLQRLGVSVAPAPVSSSSDDAVGHSAAESGVTMLFGDSTAEFASAWSSHAT
eukprot:SAG11_NODE_282_length_11247_cov_11.050323_5_plen_217_part_00